MTRREAVALTARLHVLAATLQRLEIAAERGQLPERTLRNRALEAQWAVNAIRQDMAEHRPRTPRERAALAALRRDVARIGH